MNWGEKMKERRREERVERRGGDEKRTGTKLEGEEKVRRGKERE